MRMWTRVLALACLWLLMAAAPVWAQKETQTVVPLTGDYAITLREGWEAQDWDGDGWLFANGGASVLVIDPVIMQDLVDTDTLSGAARALAATYDALYGDRIASGDIEILDFADYDAAIWYFSQGSDGDGAFIVIALGDDLYAAFDVVAPTRLFDDVIADVELMAATLSSDELEATATSEVSGLTPVTSGEPCTVSTDTRDSARLRVGPGFNRTAVAFLPPGQIVDVIGQSADDEGNVWYQLDKAQAAPNSAANEIWVLADEVSAEGDCASVEVVAGSAVIPIAPPPPQTDTGGGSGGQAPAPVTGAVTPQNGTWRLTWDSVTRVSCQGSGNVNIPTVEAFPGVSLSFTATLSVFDGGSAFNFDGDVFRLQPDGIYFGTYTLSWGNSQVRFRPITATSMSGELVGNEVVNGVPCSYTLFFTMSR